MRITSSWRLIWIALRKCSIANDEPALAKAIDVNMKYLMHRSEM